MTTPADTKKAEALTHLRAAIEQLHLAAAAASRLEGEGYAELWEAICEAPDPIREIESCYRQHDPPTGLYEF